MTKNYVPLILAPAGIKASFLAALAAGADAVYCGLKSFSARMEAKNFSAEELASLTQLAHEKKTTVYVALNSLMKPEDLDEAGKLLDQLNRRVKPDALIIQDMSLLQLAEQTGFSGEIHLSTLAAVSLPMALKLIRENMGHRIDCVVLPRELNIDEIKLMAQACPEGPDLEVFVHGALCYGVSGRCYWSSYFGGKSGLRGRCVQPCRRLYTQNDQSHSSFRERKKEDQPKKIFSCQDLSLDVLVKVLLSVPKVRAWKIEGRKKGPHYVYYTVKAYQILRDHGNDPQMKKTALGLLSQALGRPGTHYYFLPQRPQNPIDIKRQTGSGLFIGRVKGSKQNPYISSREELLSGDVLRIGYEGESGHSIHRVGKYVPRGGQLHLKFSSQKKGSNAAPVFLTDRREKALEEMLSQLEGELTETPQIPPSNFHARLPGVSPGEPASLELRVSRDFGKEKFKDQTEGVWLSPDSNFQFPISNFQFIWWWLPPVIWPEEEEKWKAIIAFVLEKGGRNFVLNSPWQMAFFPDPGQGHGKNKKSLNLWAGPFCNITNVLAIRTMSVMGFSGVIVSPELSGEDYLQLPKHSSLPLGIVIWGEPGPCVFPNSLENLKNRQTFYLSLRARRHGLKNMRPMYGCIPIGNWI